jgi:alpha-glucosidase
VAIAEPVFAFERSYAGSKILAAFNLSDETVEAHAPELENWRQIASAGVLEGELARGRLRLPARSALFAKTILRNPVR